MLVPWSMSSHVTSSSSSSLARWPSLSWLSRSITWRRASSPVTAAAPGEKESGLHYYADPSGEGIRTGILPLHRSVGRPPRRVGSPPSQLSRHTPPSVRERGQEGEGDWREREWLPRGSVGAKEREIGSFGSCLYTCPSFFIVGLCHEPTVKTSCVFTIGSWHNLAVKMITTVSSIINWHVKMKMIFTADSNRR